MIIEIINNSFLLNESQKKYLLEKVKTSSESYIKNITLAIKQENHLITTLLKKYKNDSNNHSIWQLQWELVTKNFEKIRNLEIQENKDDFFDIDKELEIF